MTEEESSDRQDESVKDSPRDSEPDPDASATVANTAAPGREVMHQMTSIFPDEAYALFVESWENGSEDVADEEAPPTEIEEGDTSG